MKSLLEKTVNSLVENDLDSAKTFFSQYIKAKSVSLLREEQLEKGLVKGHCDNCGEEAVVNQRVANSGRWECPHCESKSFKADESQ